MLDEAGGADGEAASSGRPWPEAVEELFRRSVCRELVQVAAPTLLLEFNLFRNRRADPLDWLVAELQTPESSALYESFVEDCLAPQGLLRTRYPALVQTLLDIATDGLAATAELAARFLDDREQIAICFGTKPIHRIRSVEPALSDRHGGGRQVVRVVVDDMLTLFYKPRPVASEQRFFELQLWLESRGALSSVCTPRVLDRGSYGWMEEVRSLPCTDAAAVGRFYRRCGELIALLHAVRGVDAHAGNLVASGEFPVLVDAEALAHPELARRGGPSGPDALTAARRSVRESVLATGMLPQWSLEDGNLHSDFSGMGGGEPKQAGSFRLRWEKLGTDFIRAVPEPFAEEAQPNLPLLDGQRTDPSRHIPQILEGFTAAYQAIASHHHGLVAEGGPISRLLQSPMRFIFRRTNDYVRILERMSEPSCFRSLRDRRTALEAALGASGGAAILASEVGAMLRADVPLFRHCPDALDMSDGANCLAGVFSQSGAAAVERRIAGFTASDRERQCALISASLTVHAIAEPEDPPGPEEAAATAGRRNDSDFASAANKIAESLLAAAFRSELDGSLAWISTRFLASQDRFRVQAADADLYSGTSGIAFFFALAARRLGEPRFAEAAEAALQPLEERLKNPSRLREEIGVGGATGIGSLVYALAAVSILLDARKWMHQAECAAASLAGLEAAPKYSPDLAAGLAGAVQALLYLYRHTLKAEHLATAEKLGRALVDMGERDLSGAVRWTVPGGKALTGLSHGAAGIAHALTALAQATDVSSFRETALEAMRWENGFYRPAQGNWLDLRGRHDQFGMSWCHGAPGIALARAGCARIGDIGDFACDIDRGLALLRRRMSESLPATDHLCCGAMGLVEIALTLASLSDRGRDRLDARSMATAVLARAERRGGFALDSYGATAWTSPGLFRGLAGIGYACLRCTDTEGSPALLLLQ